MLVFVVEFVLAEGRVEAAVVELVQIILLPHYLKQQN
jgi:hypothetical protein